MQSSVAASPATGLVGGAGAGPSATPGSSFLSDVSPAATPLRKSMIEELLAATPVPPSRTAQPPAISTQQRPAAAAPTPVLAAAFTPELGSVLSPVGHSALQSTFRYAHGNRIQFLLFVHTPLQQACFERTARTAGAWHHTVCAAVAHH